MIQHPPPPRKDTVFNKFPIKNIQEFINQAYKECFTLQPKVAPCTQCTLRILAIFFLYNQWVPNVARALVDVIQQH